MSIVSPLHPRPGHADLTACSRWPWAFASGVTAIGLLAADLAIGEMIDGAPTAAGQRLVGTSALAALVLVPLGLGLRRLLRRSIDRSPPAGAARRPAAYVVGALAAGWAGTRVPMVLSRLLWHVSLDADEPLTTLSLGLQLLLSTFTTATVALIAIVEYRGTRPRISATRPSGSGHA